MIEAEIKGNKATAIVLPKGWRWAGLGEVCVRITNGTTKPQNTERLGLPVTRIETISSGCIDMDRVGWVELSDDEIVKYSLEPGDILFSHINSVERLGNCAIYSDNENTLMHGMNLLRLQVDRAKVDPLFLLYYLRSEHAIRFYRDYARRAIGQASLNTQDLYGHNIPLPPTLEEQKRIACILNEQMAAVEKARAAVEARLEAAEALPAAYLRAVFEGEEAKGWPRKRLGEVCRIVGGNTLPDPDDYIEPDKIFCLKVSDLKGPFSDGHGLKGGSYAVSPQVAGERILGPGAIIFPKRGGAIATNEKRILTVRAVLDPNLMGIQSKSDSNLLSPYLYLWLQNLNIASLQSGNTVPQVNQQDLSPLEIPLPDVEMQQRCAFKLNENISRAKEIVRHAQQELETINALPAALLRRAFTGGL